MEFIRVNPNFPVSSAVIQEGKMLESVLVGLAASGDQPVPGGAGAELRDIFQQLDEILSEAGLDKTHICTVRLYLQNVDEDVVEVNEVYKDYFGDHPPTRRCYGVNLQKGLAVEAGFVAEFPPE